MAPNLESTTTKASSYNRRAVDENEPVRTHLIIILTPQRDIRSNACAQQVCPASISPLRVESLHPGC